MPTFIADPKVLFHGWLVYSYLQIFKLIKCKWLSEEDADWFLDNIMTWTYCLHRRCTMSRQKNIILTNEHALNREPGPLNVTCTARFVKVRLFVIKSKAIFTQYRITLEQTRKPYQIEFLLKHKNDHFGAISVTERSCGAPILKLVEIGFCHGLSSPACEPAFGPQHKKRSRSEKLKPLRRK